MPSWSRKDELQYEVIKESSRRRGLPLDLAEEIAARTVNKHRRQEGRTPNKRTEGTGNPRHALEERTKDELENLAADRGIKGRRRMKKADLIKAIRGK